MDLVEERVRHLPERHPPVRFGKLGILLVNLGTPEDTSYFSMRRYLKEFLSDRRVIETNRFFWWILLNVIILTTRPFRSGRAYDKIWNYVLDESPLKTVTRAQSKDLALLFSERYDDVIVDWGMRYGHPSIEAGLLSLCDLGCDRILLVPLYPQYSASTSASVFDKAAEVLGRMRYQPVIRVLPPWYDSVSYIDALESSLRSHMRDLSWSADVILLSFHGLPQSYLLRGDPYYCHCMKTARLLRDRFGGDGDYVRVVFQSRFGREEWLRPYAVDVVESLGKAGVENIVVCAPGFVSDCVETLEELDIGLRELFEVHGGKNFSMVPCLNDSRLSLDLLYGLIFNELQGWL